MVVEYAGQALDPDRIFEIWYGTEHVFDYRVFLIEWKDARAHVEEHWEDRMEKSILADGDYYE